MRVFVVRSGRHWDNPKIEFITEDRGIARKIVEGKERAKFERNREFSLKYANELDEEADFIQSLLDHPEIKIPNHFKEVYLGIYDDAEGMSNDYKPESKREQAARQRKQETSFEEHLKSADWFYEEHEFVNTLEEAKALLRISDDVEF
jgi:hypothetical protein